MSLSVMGLAMRDLKIWFGGGKLGEGGGEVLLVEENTGLVNVEFNFTLLYARQETS